MIPPKPPPHIPGALRARLGVAQMADDCTRTVALAEAAGLRVEVRRLQLGRTTAPGFGEVRVVYRTGETERTCMSATISTPAR